MDYASIYEHWKDLPQCRIYLEGETLWGRKLPDETIGLDNDPLDRRYRWQDIVRMQSGNLPELVHRRWNALVQFRWRPAETETEDLVIRERIWQAGHTVGGVNFFTKGLGYVLVEELEGAVEKVQKALGTLEGVEVNDREG